MGSSDSEDSFLDADIMSDNVNSLVQRCRDFVPMSCNASLSVIRSKLCKAKAEPTPNVSSHTRSIKVKPAKVEDSLRELSNEALQFSQKLNCIIDSFISIVDTIETLDKRISVIEAGNHNRGESQSYAAIASQTLKSNDGRIGKLEYQNSEEDRKKRLLEVSITHPSINPGSNSLRVDTLNFFSEKLKMSNREIDQSFTVHKTSRNNTIIVRLTDRKFKLFLFNARKKLRLDNPSTVTDLYLNDNLSSYNFSILMTLKRLRSDRRNANKKVFETTYTIDGKIFVKMQRGDSNENAINIKTKCAIDKLIADLDKPVSQHD